MNIDCIHDFINMSYVCTMDGGSVLIFPVVGDACETAHIVPGAGGLLWNNEVL